MFAAGRYLEYEWRARKGEGAMPNFNEPTIPLIQPEVRMGSVCMYLAMRVIGPLIPHDTWQVPKQKNGFDCGVFVLLYGEMVRHG
jgi:hypothetical protein